MKYHVVIELAFETVLVSRECFRSKEEAAAYMAARYQNFPAAEVMEERNIPRGFRVIPFPEKER